MQITVRFYGLVGCFCLRDEWWVRYIALAKADLATNRESHAIGQTGFWRRAAGDAECAPESGAPESGAPALNHRSDEEAHSAEAHSQEAHLLDTHACVKPGVT